MTGPARAGLLGRCRPWPLAALLLLALLARGICCLATLAPDRDTAHYVHMARTLRAGDWQASLSEVFPPLHPAVLAAVGPIGGSGPRAWWTSGQITATVLDVLSVPVMVIAVSPALGPGAALVAGTWLAAGLLPAWQAGDAMSEGCFRLLLSLWLLAWLRGGRRWSRFLPLLASLLFVTRTEGGILLLPAAWRLLRQGGPWGIPALLAGVAPGALYLWLRAAATGSFEVLPLAGFMRHLSVFAEADLAAALAHYVREAMNLARRGFDGLGYLGYPCFLAACGLLLTRGRATRPSGLLEFRWPLLAALVALAAVPLYFGNRRFWTPWLPLLLPVAAVPLVLLAEKGAAKGARITLAVVFVVALAAHAVRIPRPRNTKLAPDLALAERLRQELPEGAGITSDLPRLLFFSGRPPLPPRSIGGEELMALARRPENRVVVSLENRGKLDAEILGSLGYSLERPLPDRGLRVWRR